MDFALSEEQAQFREAARAFAAAELAARLPISKIGSCDAVCA